MSKHEASGRAIAVPAVAAVLISLVLAGCGPEPRPVRQEGVLRVLSWNTFNLPTIAGEMGQVNLDEEDRGRLVARLLKRSGYEVIALNEVFDETVRDALIEEAESGSDAFRFVVEDLDGGGLEDSGLVLLSRLEPIRFAAPAPMPGQHGDLPWLTGTGYTEPFAGTAAYLDTRHCAHMDVWWKGHGDDGEVDAWVDDAGANCLIAFHRYRACTDETPDDSPFGAECEAGKGVGYVRLLQQNGAPLDVFWSHMQATLRSPEYELPLPDFETERREQLEELAAMVGHWSPADEHDTLIMGDLNVDGLGAPDAPQEYGRLLAVGPGSLLGRMGSATCGPRPHPARTPAPAMRTATTTSAPSCPTSAWTTCSGATAGAAASATSIRASSATSTRSAPAAPASTCRTTSASAATCAAAPATRAGGSRAARAWHGRSRRCCPLAT